LAKPFPQQEKILAGKPGGVKSMFQMDRRQMLRASIGMVAYSVLGLRRKAFGTPSATVHERKIISHRPHLFHGWPTVARRRNGDLLLVYSGGREAHVCPFGRVELMQSRDGGDTWTWPRVVMDSPIDDRDAGVLETTRGSILITTFTSLAYESQLVRAEKIISGQPGAWPEERLARWRAAHERATTDGREAALGVWMMRSTDGGITFSGRYFCQVNSPHGPVQLSDGRLVYAGKELWQGKHRIGVCESNDDGRTWQWLATIPTREGDDQQQYHELHAVEAADGRLIVQIRNHNPVNAGETLQTESSDGGKSWSMPRPIGVWGLP
jgi:sialidase-1